MIRTLNKYITNVRYVFKIENYCRYFRHFKAIHIYCIMTNRITCSSYRESQIETETNRLTFIEFF